MRALLFVGVLLLALVAPVQADDGLTSRIAIAYFPRTVDAGLHTIAHQRAAELAACGCLEHDRLRAGTAEVIAYNSGLADPVGTALASWIGSPTHAGILANASYGRIGCAQAVAGGVSYFACVLAAGPLPVAPAPAAPVQGAAVLGLPDTAMPFAQP